MMVGIGMSVFILIILALMVFTDLGKRPDPTPPSKDHHVDDVPLRAPRSK
jgi:hypothetical protein